MAKRHGVGGKRMSGRRNVSASRNTPTNAAGGVWRAGVPSAPTGAKPRYNSNPGGQKTTQPAVHGASVGNMGDLMPVTGRNVPRGMFDQINVRRSILAEGSAPLGRRGRR